MCFEVMLVYAYLCILDCIFLGFLILENFKASKFSSCKGLLRVCQTFQDEIFCEGSFHIYFFLDKNLKSFVYYCIKISLGMW